IGGHGTASLGLVDEAEAVHPQEHAAAPLVVAVEVEARPKTPEEKMRHSSDAQARRQAARVAADEAQCKAEVEERAGIAAEAEALGQPEAHSRLAPETPRDEEGDAAHPVAAKEEKQSVLEEELAGEVDVRREPVVRSAPRTLAPRYRA